MVWITTLFALLVLAWALLRIVLEEYIIEHSTGYWLDWLISTIFVGLYAFILWQSPISPGLCLLNPIGLSLWCFLCSAWLPMLANKVLGWADDVSPLEPFFPLIMALLLMLVWVPSEGMKLIGFPNLLTNHTLLFITAGIGEGVLLGFHFWLNEYWDLDQPALIIHWILSTILIIGLFALAYHRVGDRTLAWLIAMVLVLFIHIEMIGILAVGKFWGEFFLITWPQYIPQQLWVFSFHCLLVCLIYIGPTIIQFMQKFFGTSK